MDSMGTLQYRSFCDDINRDGWVTFRLQQLNILWKKSLNGSGQQFHQYQ